MYLEICVFELFESVRILKTYFIIIAQNNHIILNSTLCLLMLTYSPANYSLPSRSYKRSLYRKSPAAIKILKASADNRSEFYALTVGNN